MIIVLDDGETFSAASGCVLAEVSTKGFGEMEEDGTHYDDLDDWDIQVEITLSDLIAAYNTVHGTNYEL